MPGGGGRLRGEVGRMENTKVPQEVEAMKEKCGQGAPLCFLQGGPGLGGRVSRFGINYSE